MTASRPLRWGILSAARINDLVVEGCRGSDELEFVAIASRDGARAHKQAAALGVPQALGSYDELLARDDVDAIYVPLPNALHVEWTKRALEAGKHVLCEKPFSADPAGVAEAFALAREHGLLLAEAFMYRFHPQTETLRELVAGGRIGELAFIHAEENFAMEDDPSDFRLRADMDGGALMDVGCYCVNAARLLAGEPERFEATAWRRGRQTDMRFVGLLELPGEVTATFHCGMDLALERSRLYLTGTRGSIVVEDPWQCLGGAIVVIDEHGREERFAPDPIDRYRAQFETFSRAAQAGEELEFGERDAVAQATALKRLFEAVHYAG